MTNADAHCDSTGLMFRPSARLRAKCRDSCATGHFRLAGSLAERSQRDHPAFWQNEPNSPSAYGSRLFARQRALVRDTST